MRMRNILLSVAILSFFLVSPVGAITVSPGSMLARAASSSNSDIHTYTVSPNGHDDTANIQAAFNACVAHGPMCTVQLVKGTYYTAQITVYGFQGSFVGMGQQWTTIQALPNLPSPAPEYNTPTIPFWAGLPGPTNPWPSLFTFWGGSFSISGMTLTDPYTAPITPGWLYYPSITGDTTLYTSLHAAIEITGYQQASATIDHVTVLGASGDAAGPNTFNMWNGIMYEGAYLPKGWANAFTDTTPLSGTLSATNSVFNTVESGPWIDNLVGATVTVCYNTITYSYGSTGFFDSYNSKLTFCGNRISNVIDFAGIAGEQSAYKSGSLPSKVYITDNQFLQLRQAASGLFLYDWGTVGTLNAVVSGNVFQTDTSCGCYQPIGYYSVIVGGNLKSFVVSQNKILGGGAAGVYVYGGPAMVTANLKFHTILGGGAAHGGPATVSGNTITGSYDGVWLNYTSGVRVTGNVIKNSAQYGIAVTDGSSNNLVTGNIIMKSGTFDLYWDQTGTGNVWHGDQCQTSSPAGLCSL